MVSTHLKNISQNRNLPQTGVKIKDIWNHHPVVDLHLYWIWCLQLGCTFFTNLIYRDPTCQLAHNKPPPGSNNKHISFYRRKTLSEQRFLTEAVHLGTQHSSLLLGDLPNANGSVQRKKKIIPPYCCWKSCHSWDAYVLIIYRKKVDFFPMIQQKTLGLWQVVSPLSFSAS